MPEEKKEEVKEYKLVKVPTGEALAIQTPEGEIMDNDYALVEILNKLDKLKKAVG